MMIFLEKWNDDEYQAFFKASNDKELYSNMSDDFPKTTEECKELVHFFASSTESNEYIRAIKIDNQIAGCIAAFFETGMYCKNAELAYWLDKSFRGQGIMPQILKKFTEHLFSDFNMHRIWARPFERNKASQRTLEKAGFHSEGVLSDSVYKNGKFLNTSVYALIKQEK